MEKQTNMRKLAILAVLALGAVVLSAASAQAQFDPAVHKLERLEPLVLGSKDNNFHMAPKEYKLRVGQGYRWKIKAETDFEYGVIAPAFFRNIWIRKVEMGPLEVKTGTLDELEFEDVGEVELFFVAIRPGTYHYSVRGAEERGMVGTIVVESGDSS
jgi:plastocyanin